MLVLSRRIGERILIGDKLTVTVLAADRRRVRLGIDAPETVPIRREEISFDPVDLRRASSDKSSPRPVAAISAAGPKSR